MKQELTEKLLEVAPMLYKYFKDNPKNVIDYPDDLFEFIFELSVKIEDFNKRFPRRRVLAIFISFFNIDEIPFYFVLQLKIP